MKLRTILLLILLLFCGHLSATNIPKNTLTSSKSQPFIAKKTAPKAIRTIQIGAYKNPTFSDFKALIPMGELYAETSQKDQLVRVRMGLYDTWKEVESTLQKVKSKGFKKAAIIKLKHREGQRPYFIQLAAYQKATQVKWDAFKGIEKLHLLFEKGTVKIGQSVWGDRQAAKKVQQKLVKKGYKSAYIRPIKPSLFATTPKTALKAVKNSIFKPNTKAAKPATYNSNKSSFKRTANIISTFTKGGNNSSKAINRPKNSSPNNTSSNLSDGFKVKYPNKMRPSVTNLQDFLAALGYYKGQVDGFWGKNTNQAVKNIQQDSPVYLGFAAAARAEKRKRQAAVAKRTKNLSYFVDLISQNSTKAAQGLRQSNDPAAKMYLAYMYMNSDIQVRNPARQASDLMYQAIQQVFKGTKADRPTGLDKYSPKNYKNLAALIKDMRFLHEEIDLDVPCWLIKRHRMMYLNSFGAYWNTDRDLVQTATQCDGFMDMEEVLLLSLLAQDMNTVNLRYQYGSAISSSFNDNKNIRLILYLTPNELDAISLDTWEDKHKELWKGLDNWAMNDANLSEDQNNERFFSEQRQRTYIALQVAYAAARLRLEDHFIDKGFNNKQARGLALKAIFSVLNFSLDEYLKYGEKAADQEDNTKASEVGEGY